MRNVCKQNSPELNFNDLKKFVWSKCSDKTLSVPPITVNDLCLNLKNLDESESMGQKKLDQSFWKLVPKW